MAKKASPGQLRPHVPELPQTTVDSLMLLYKPGFACLRTFALSLLCSQMLFSQSTHGSLPYFVQYLGKCQLLRVTSLATIFIILSHPPQKKKTLYILSLFFPWNSSSDNLQHCLMIHYFYFCLFILVSTCWNASTVTAKDFCCSPAVAKVVNMGCGAWHVSGSQHFLTNKWLMSNIFSFISYVS